MAGIVLLTAVVLSYYGISYYSTSLEERFYHTAHDYFKPSGIFGHGLGIVGTLLIFIGVTSYIFRKRYKFMARWGRLKHWLEFHIFLCSLGPVMILFHTAFKFGGIVSIAFWSMVAVVASGVVGRFIYIQIPRSIEGQALNLGEVKALKTNIGAFLKDHYHLEEQSYAVILEAVKVKPFQETGSLAGSIINKHREDYHTLRKVRHLLKENQLSRPDIRKITKLVRNEISLNNRIEQLHTMQKLFKYWHVAHLPFALIMLVIVLLHIGITLAFGYTWIL